jgi:predicted lipid-binding transport protein (Tim44 family)
LLVRLALDALYPPSHTSNVSRVTFYIHMPLLGSLNDTAANADTKLPWPISGLAYVCAFMGPLTAGPMLGLMIGDWRVGVVGLLIGIGIDFINCWLTGKFIEPLIKRFQPRLQKGPVHVLANIVAFVWAIMLCALSMFAPIAVFGASILTKIQ